MKSFLVIPLAAAAIATVAHAQSAVYRCTGNLFTTDPVEAKAKGCKPFVSDGGSVTVVQGTRVNNPAAASSGVKLASAPSQFTPNARVETDEQRSRDADARAILESELKKAEARQAELAREYNNGEPEMLGPEHRNRQKYIDRVAELKASLTRNENDIAGIKRELSRLK